LNPDWTGHAKVARTRTIVNGRRGEVAGRSRTVREPTKGAEDAEHGRHPTHRITSRHCEGRRRRCHTSVRALAEARGRVRPRGAGAPIHATGAQPGAALRPLL